MDGAGSVMSNFSFLGDEAPSVSVDCLCRVTDPELRRDGEEGGEGVAVWLGTASLSVERRFRRVGLEVKIPCCERSSGFDEPGAISLCEGAPPFFRVAAEIWLPMKAFGDCSGGLQQCCLISLWNSNGNARKPESGAKSSVWVCECQQANCCRILLRGLGKLKGGSLGLWF